MPWPFLMAYANGESRDTTCESDNGDFPSAAVSTVTSSATFAATGDRSVLFPFSAAGNNYVASTRGLALTDFGMAFSGKWRLTTDPTGEIPLISTEESAANKDVHVGIGTDRKISIYARVGTTMTFQGKSLGTISTSAFTELQIFWFNRGNPNAASPAGTNRWFAIIYIDGLLDSVHEFHGPFTNSIFWDTSNPFCVGGITSSGLGADLYGDDIILEATNVKDDAPWITQYPRLASVGGMMTPPAVDATYSEWTVDVGGVTTGPHYEGVDDDELDNHDVDGSYIQATSNSLRELFHYTVDLLTTDTIPSGATIWGMSRSWVIRTVGSSKTAADFFGRFNSTDQASTGAGVGETYVGLMPIAPGWVVKPGGTISDWARADAGLSGGNSLYEFGARSHSTGTVTCRITLMPGPDWWWYEDLLPLAPAPFHSEHRRKPGLRNLLHRWQQGYTNDLRIQTMHRRLVRPKQAFQVAVGGTLRFTGTLTRVATFRRSLSGVLRFTGAVATVFMSGAGGASNIIKRWLRHRS